MTQTLQDIRSQTLALVRTGAGASVTSAPMQLVLIEAWLNALETEDLADLHAPSLASILWDGFSSLAAGNGDACQVVPLRYADGHGGWASALLIHNPDMPFLVDSIVMAMRRLQIASMAVLNAVLTVRRDAAAPQAVTDVARARTGGDSLESFVLCLLREELSESRQATLENAVRMVAGDAASVQRDSYAINRAMIAVASLAGQNIGKHADATAAASAAAGTASAADDAMETAAFLEWAIDSGFEAFGYAFYRATPGTHVLERDLESRIGVLRDTSHPVYDRCLAGIPGEYTTLSARPSALSVVKADVASTLHRDQHLDFIGFREKDASGAIVGEHCFIGLFSRSASVTPLSQLPFVRGRIAQVMELAGVRSEGFRAEKFLEILESLPRTEIFESDAQFLAGVCSTVVALYKQPRARVFARNDVYGRHLNLLIYLPRERYSEALAAQVAARVRDLSGAREVRMQTLVADGPLARLYLIASHAQVNLALDSDIEQPLLQSIEGWSLAFDALVDTDMVVALRAPMRRLAMLLPPDYVIRTSPSTAYRDLSALLAIQSVPRIKVHVESGPQGEVEIHLLSVGSAPSLSVILPALQNAGVAIDREQTFEVVTAEDERFFVACLTVDSHSAAQLAKPDVTEAAQELFEMLLNDEAEDGRMNALVIEAGLRTREVQVVRAYASYWRQAGCRFSLRYMADCLKRQPNAVRTLINGYLLRFDPQATLAERESGRVVLEALRNDLTDINHADTEDILKSLAELIQSTLRTSFFQEKRIGDTITFKFDCSALSMLPVPRPYRELFVFSRRFEGVHLRGGPVARGGLRWSDRMEDYRTEVLGLVKAQMVKNAVIVPAGAKGGFVCKQLPKEATREAVAAEGEAVYRLFIAGLLDMTDNRLPDEIVMPPETVCYDAADPYLVVAADKGTATFSDIANGIAVERGFWLGDAFASGGSNGYDHKKLGITAKGAWEAVKRHFFELDHDLADRPITVAGVGDMSGDVFGNGLLQSRQLRLIAAFDHRHIFIDPAPDTVVSYGERQRLFRLQRSSWDEYQKDLISEGGGVWPRTARSITLSPQVRAALGTTVVSATPEELLRLILLAPVDLFYNGGIGTYIKASTETHAEVKDRANDAIRVDGRQLRCRVVAEGGNLGVTQAGRIEFALAGGQIFTDAIDNSAGVDCSDHEVNLKIWLDTEVAAGSLSAEHRNLSLIAVTGDIETLILRDNILQTHLLAREEQAQADPGARHAYVTLIDRLEAGNLIVRSAEQLPDAAELVRRSADGYGLSAPELAVVMAHVKNRYKHLLAALPLTEENWARTVLAPYFPPALVASRDPLQHPLANAILATVVANEAVNRCGLVMIATLAERHAMTETDVLLAWARGWAALNLRSVFDALDAGALRVRPEVSRDTDRRCRALQEAVICGVLSIPIQAEDVDAAPTSAGLDELTRLFHDAGADALCLGGHLGAPHASSESANLAFMSADPDPVLAAFANANQTVDAIEASADFMFATLAIARPAHMSLLTLLTYGVQVRQRVGIDLLERALTHTRADAGETVLRSHALQVLRRAQQHLLTRVLNEIADLPVGDARIPVRIGAEIARVSVASGDAWDSLDTAILRTWTLSEAVLTPAKL